MMRETLSRALMRAAEADPKLILLTGDHGNDLFREFRASRPLQFINAGIAEQNMVGVAAGLARAGYSPIVYALASFLPSRVLEQIKIDVCHDVLNVKFLGDGAGLVYSYWGTTHQCFDDIACMRVMPSMRIFSPGDATELDESFRLLLQARGPGYMRIGKSGLGELRHELEPPLAAVRQVSRSPSPFAAICTGPVCHQVLSAAPEGDGWNVYSVWQLKPFDSVAVRAIAAESRGVVTVEEHSIHGGLGSMVSEALNGTGVPVLRVAIEDRFSETCGSYEHLLRENGLHSTMLRDRIGRWAATLE